MTVTDQARRFPTGTVLSEEAADDSDRSTERWER
jgi:hypothetical protein